MPQAQIIGEGVLDEMTDIWRPEFDKNATRFVTALNGTKARMSGYMLPLETSGSGVTEFILVPYAGACVHVPPPPPNQLVFVTTGTPYNGTGLFEAVNVTGMFGTASTSTQLADIGYALSADLIEPFHR